MVRGFSVSLARLRQSCMTEMGKNSEQRGFVLWTPLQLTWTRRATYIKGDPYIRDMKHTRSIIHTSSYVAFHFFR